MQQHPQLSSIPVVVSTADPTKAPAGVLVLPKPVQLARLLDEIAARGLDVARELPSDPLEWPAP